MKKQIVLAEVKGFEQWGKVYCVIDGNMVALVWRQSNKPIFGDESAMINWIEHLHKNSVYMMRSLDAVELFNVEVKKEF